MSAPNSRNISEADLGEILTRAGVPLPPTALRQLWQFHNYLRQQNPRLNLTRIYNFQAMARKHYVDSLLVAPLLERRGISWPDLTLDLGTGPGFPGIPLAICKPDHRFILAEGRALRVAFLQEAVRICGLTNAEVFGGRIHAGRGRPVDAVITRAVERIPATIDRTLPFLSAGGLLIFMKGPNCSEEIEQAQGQYGDLVELALDEAYTLPDSTDHRRLVVWRRRTGNSGPRPRPTGDEAPRVISSSDNETFKSFRNLHTSRGIKKQGLALVSGRRVVAEYLERVPELCRELLVPETRETRDRQSRESLARILAIAPGLPLRVFSRELFQELDLIGTGPPLLIIEPRPIPDFDPAAPPVPGCTLFLPMGDPENLGAALRSAAAFGIKKCVLLREAAHPYHPRALRAAAGATPALNLENGTGLAQLPEGEQLFALDAGGADIRENNFPGRFILLAGQEGGHDRLFAHDRLSDLEFKKVRIPMGPAVESLNTTVALSIALFILKEKNLI